MPTDLSCFKWTSMVLRFISSHKVNPSYHYNIHYGNIVLQHRTLEELTLCFDSTTAHSIDYDDKGRLVATVRLDDLDESTMLEMNTDVELLNLNPEYLRGAVVSYAHVEVAIDNGTEPPVIVEDALHLDYAQLTLVELEQVVGIFSLKSTHVPFKYEQIRFKELTL